jgi:hypothetical protein
VLTCESTPKSPMKHTQTLPGEKKKRPRIGPKEKAVGIMLAQGETHRTTADALGISRGTVLALSKQQILSETEVAAVERGIREKAARVAEKALDEILNNPEKLKKSRGVELSKIALDMKRIGEGDKPNNIQLFTTLMKGKYAVEPPQPVVVNPTDNTYDTE